MCQGLLVPWPGGYSSEVLIRGVGEEDVKVRGAVQAQDLFQFLHVQVGPAGTDTNPDMHMGCLDHISDGGQSKRKERVEKQNNQVFV